MNAPMSSSHFDLWMIAGWTMIHFLWLGTLVALAAFVSRGLLRRASANVRYVTALTCLAIIAALPVATAVWLATYSPLLKGGQWRATSSQAGGRISSDTPERLAPTIPFTIELHAASPPSAPASAGGSTGTHGHASTALSAQTTTNPRQIQGLPELQSPLTFATAFDQLATCIPYLPCLWLIGTPITFALTATGLLGTRRLSRASRPITDGPIAEALTQLAASLRLTRRVVVAVCDRIAAPVLIGILRPIILLPPAALTGYSADEIEMVLLHELAHVRRWDNLVNLMQRLVESLLFFHPAVWLISSWVRRERETCCDALVVTRTDRPHAYAELLVALSAQMPRSVLFHPAASSAMAAGPLRSRIRRILQLDDDPMLISGKSFAAILATLAIAATLTVLYAPTIGQAEQSATKDTKGTKNSTTKELTTEGTENTEGTKKVDRNRKADTSQTQNNLKNIVLAMHNYHDMHKSFPPHAQYSTDQITPLLSWRVLILPLLGEEQLYKEFHLDEPWDSDHNRRLIARMPKVFKNPKLDKPGMTNYLAVVGKECVFNGSPKGLGLKAILDGTSNTIVVVETNADLAIEWTKPQDWNFDRGAPTKGLGHLWGDGWYAAWCDGSIRRISNSESADEVGIKFTRNGGEQKSLKESANRLSAGATEMDPGVEGGPGGRYEFAEAGPGMPAEGATPTSKFPTLEDQKLADLAYKWIGLELEPIGADDLKRVKALGYDGGVKVTAGTAGVSEGGGFSGNTSPRIILPDDILVGLHVWPTTNMKDLAAILNRDDLAELNPLKFYVVRQLTQSFSNAPAKTHDELVTGRVSVQLSGGSGAGGGRSSSTAPASSGPQASWPTKDSRYQAPSTKPNRNWSNDNFTVPRAVPTNPGSTPNLPPTLNSEGWTDPNSASPAASRQPTVQLTAPLPSPPPVTTPTRSVLAVPNTSQQSQPPLGSQPAPNPSIPRVTIAPATPTNSPAALAEPYPTPTPNAPQAGPAIPALPSEPADPFAAAAPNSLESATRNHPLFIMFFYTPDRSDPMNKIHEQIKELKSQNVGNPVGAIINMQNDAELAKSYKVTRSPTYIIFHNGKEAVRLVGVDQTEKLVATIKGLVTETVPTEQTSAPKDKSELRYDGNTFDEWQKAWQTELSTEKRIEAVKALAAFGANGYGPQAAESILDVAAQYDFSPADSENDDKLKEAIVDHLAPDNRTQPLAKYWVPILAERLKKDPNKWQGLAIQLLYHLRANDEATSSNLYSFAKAGPNEVRAAALGALVASSKARSGGPKIDDKSRELLVDALQSKNPSTIAGAIRLVLYYPPNMGGGVAQPPKLIFQKELVPLLFHSDEEICQQARGVLRYISKEDAPPVIKQLVTTIQDKSRQQDHIHAIRGLAAIGGGATDAINELARLRTSSQDKNILVATLVAIGRIKDGDLRKTGTVGGVFPSMIDGLSEEEKNDLSKRVGRLESKECWDNIMRENNSLLPSESKNPGGGGGGGFF